jgi:hypothetical protein
MSSSHAYSYVDVKHFIINDQKVCEGTRILLHSHPIQVLDNAKSANYPILNENTIVCPDGYCFHVQPEPSISRRCLGVRFYSGNLASAQGKASHHLLTALSSFH